MQLELDDARSCREGDAAWASAVAELHERVRRLAGLSSRYAGVRVSRHVTGLPLTQGVKGLRAVPVPDRNEGGVSAGSR